jgi:peptidoglycan/xylan/chitin deacetylase (PgdA/CDA1 family)
MRIDEETQSVQARIVRIGLAVALVVGVAGAAIVGLVVAGDDEAKDTVTSGGTEPTTTAPAPTSTGTSSPEPTTTTTTTVTTATAGGTSRSPTTVASGPAVVVRRGDPSRAVVALTFDAGSDVGYASEILDVLAANHVPATFGMTGRWAEAHPALVGRMAAEGHQLVNHSYDHPSFTGQSTGEPALSRGERLDQLARTEAAVGAAADTTTLPWFRPPYGDEDASVRADVAVAGYRYELLWTVDSLGWRGISSDEVVQRCLERAVPGAIFLLHVGAESTDHDALQRIIDGLRARGYGFATVEGIT